MNCEVCDQKIKRRESHYRGYSGKGPWKHVKCVEGNLVTADSPKLERPTPETDTLMDVWRVGKLLSVGVMLDHARKLERERDEAREQLKANHECALILEKMVYQARQERDEARGEVERLREENYRLAAIAAVPSTDREARSERANDSLNASRILCEQQLDEARAEVARLKTMSVCELGSHNDNVREYIAHWEGRALKAERERDEARAKVERLRNKVLEERLAQLEALRLGNKHIAELTDEVARLRESLRCLLNPQCAVEEAANG